MIRCRKRWLVVLPCGCRLLKRNIFSHLLIPPEGKKFKMSISDSDMEISITWFVNVAYFKQMLDLHRDWFELEKK